MLIGRRTVPPEAQQAVIQARLDNQAALDHFKRVLNKRYIRQVEKIVSNQACVSPQFGCPECGERRMDWLLLYEGDREGWVLCRQCDTEYHIDSKPNVELLPCEAEQCSNWSPSGHCADCSF